MEVTLVVLNSELLGAICVHLPWVRVGRGANCFGYFKWQVITLPRVQVALGAHCLGCELLGVQIGLVTLNGKLSRCFGCNLLWVQLALKLRVALVASCLRRELPWEL